VHLSSGEWLRGEFKRMRKKKFEFRSTRMKKQTIDWKHVREFCFANETRFILYDHTVLSGRGRLVGGRLTVVDVDVTQTAPRADIWAILPGLPTELNRWRATISAGLDAYSGNTDQQNLTASMTVDREDASTHLDLGYTTSFGRSDGVDNVKRHRATAQYDVYFNRSLFAVLPYLEYTSDTFQNIQQRVVPALGLGYRFFDLDDFEWEVQAGAAYQYTQYVSVQPGQSLRENDVGPYITTNLIWDITGDLTFAVSQNAILLIRDFNQSNFHTQGSLVYDVTDLIYLEFSVWYDRVLQPRETSAGSLPDANDTRTVVSIGLNFD
jgi:putative salt-induced outer membrane protein YdiY